MRSASVRGAARGAPHRGRRLIGRRCVLEWGGADAAVPAAIRAASSGGLHARTRARSTGAPAGLDGDHGRWAAGLSVTQTQQRQPQPVPDQPQPQTTGAPSRRAMRPPPTLPRGSHQWSTYAQMLARVPRPPKPLPHVFGTRTHSSQPGLMRERTRPRRPPRIHRRHDPPFANSDRTPPTGPPEPDSGQLPWRYDIMAVSGRVHLPARPRKPRTCSHVHL